MTQGEKNPGAPRVAVFGAGSFGTAIADLLGKKGLDVVLWGRDAAAVAAIAAGKGNPKFLDGAPLSGFRAETDLAAAAVGRDICILAVPCQGLRPFLERAAPRLPREAILVNLAKGVEIGTFLTPSQIIADVLGGAALARFATVSGPTFAEEIYRGMPTGAVVASANDAVAEAVQRAMSGGRFRLYRLRDVTGVELGGALKNVMAIAVGISEGLGFGHNTRAGLLTRCLHEMTEFGIARGANARTFSGLSGVGDLVLTCTGDLSRNRQAGLRIGRGEAARDVIASLTRAVEGVPTAKAVHFLSLNLGIDMPNTAMVHKILHENFPPKRAVDELLSRELKPEYED